MTDKTIFEEIKHINEIGQEYWSARELFAVLEYVKWDKFLNVISKAKQACQNSGLESNDHFPRVEKMVDLGSRLIRMGIFCRQSRSLSGTRIDGFIMMLTGG